MPPATHPPSERSLAAHLVGVTLGLTGFIAFMLFLVWAGFFPDITTIL